MSPTLVEHFQKGLSELLSKLYADAKQTDNKWDDLGIEMIAKVFQVELKEQE